MPKITLENIIKIISKNITEPISNINIKSNSDDFDRWDSLSHIRIIIDLEKIYGKKINTSKYGELISVKAILEYLNK